MSKMSPEALEWLTKDTEPPSIEDAVGNEACQNPEPRYIKATLIVQ